MKKVTQQYLTGERALFKGKDLDISLSTFADGESPLKESENVNIDRSLFRWKYPLWYSRDAKVTNSALSDTARAGIWYTKNVEIADTVIEAPKTFRRTNGITLKNVDMPNAAETLWMCDDTTLSSVTAKGNYFGMNSRNIRASNLRFSGDYGFDGCRNIDIEDSVLLSKDAFWNCENVTVKGSTIVGEYIGWNSKNLTFIDCTIESLQGFCYIENLTLINCRLINTTLAFEYCTVDAEVTTRIDSIKNPISGSIRAAEIGEIIFDDPAINPDKTTIISGTKVTA